VAHAVIECVGHLVIDAFTDDAFHVAQVIGGEEKRGPPCETPRQAMSEQPRSFRRSTAAMTSWRSR